MIQTMDRINELQITINTMEMLKKISKRLRKYNEYECNYGELTKRQNTLKNKMEITAIGLAKTINMRVYFQNDPRGCALYLIDETMDDTNYNNGIALC